MPGPQLPLYAFGAPVREIHPFVPLASDHATGIAAFSYDGRIFLGLNGDAHAAPDLAVLRDPPGRISLHPAGRHHGRMAPMTSVPVGSLPFERFASVLDEPGFERVAAAAARARELLEARVVWNVNSTARGGGVAEMLVSLLAYARGAGVDARWQVIAGNGAFFAVTKRIHNWLHGAPGDGGRLGQGEREVYEAALVPNAEALAEVVSRRDVVVLHDPQTAGLVPAMKSIGIPVIWRCHVGIDAANDVARRAWDFLLPYAREADACVFSRRAFAWPGLDESRIVVIPPTIDAFSAKNQELARPAVDAVLSAAGLMPDRAAGEPVFRREDGSPARVDRRAQLWEDRPLSGDERIVVQVSRWDRLKDPLGVVRGFAEHVAPHLDDAHLVYAGPAVEAVSDDPEGREVLDQACEARASLPPAARERVHLACVPMDDLEENAAIVNALQRRADVVVQKSIAEGFGLTVAEAMWKGRPVVASRIGGIQDQIEDGVSGVLLDDPRDLAAYGAAVRDLLDDRARAERLGTAAQARVREGFLGVRSLLQYLELIGRLLAVRGG